MRSRSYLLISVLAGLAATVQADASDVRQPQSVAAASETAATVRFDLYQGYCIVVHGSAGNLKNLNFCPGYRHDPFNFQFADREKT